jgi:hypothetical protein
VASRLLSRRLEVLSCREQLGAGAVETVRRVHTDISAPATSKAMGLNAQIE